MTRGLLILAISLTACAPQPRSRSYFIAHPAEAARVVAACKSGTTRGAECDNAEAGVVAAQTDKDIQFFKRSF